MGHLPRLGMGVAIWIHWSLPQLVSLWEDLGGFLVPRTTLMRLILFGIPQSNEISRSLRCSGWECSLGRSGSWWSCQPKSESVPCSIFIAERVVMGFGCCIRVLFNFPSPDFEIGGGIHSVLELLFFWVGWSNLLIFTGFSTTSPFPFLSPPFFHFCEPLLPKPPKITTNGGATPGLKPQDNHRILRKAKLCTLLNWAPPRLKPVVLSKADSCAVWEGLEGEKRGNHWKVGGTHHTLEVMGFCRHSFGGWGNYKKSYRPHPLPLRSRG